MLCRPLFSEGFLRVGERRSSFPLTSRYLTRQRQQMLCKTRLNNWLGDLWEEVIEFSTYGPAERKMLQARRQALSKAEKAESTGTTKNKGDDDDDASLASFRQAKQKLKQIETPPLTKSENDDNASLSLQAFQSVVASAKSKDQPSNLDFDGYALRDLLVAKWGMPLDIDFQRGYSQQTLYCTILPVAFGSNKCRHINELDYLMHLQAVVEILHEYNNLEDFRGFIESTNRTPKPGVESVPFRLELSPQQQRKVLGVPK